MGKTKMAVNTRKAEMRKLDSAKEATIDLVALNNTVVNMRSVVRAAKVHVIHKLSRMIPKLKSKKGTEEQKQKNLRKAQRMLDEIFVIKGVNADSVTKFALANTATFGEVCKQPTASTEVRSLLRLSEHKLLADKVKAFRSLHADWADMAAYLTTKQTGRRFRTKEQKMRAAGKATKFVDLAILTGQLGGVAGQDGPKKSFVPRMNFGTTATADHSSEETSADQQEMDKSIADADEKQNAATETDQKQNAATDADQKQTTDGGKKRKKDDKKKSNPLTNKQKIAQGDESSEKPTEGIAQKNRNTVSHKQSQDEKDNSMHFDDSSSNDDEHPDADTDSGNDDDDTEQETSGSQNGDSDNDSDSNAMNMNSDDESDNDSGDDSDAVHMDSDGGEEEEDSGRQDGDSDEHASSADDDSESEQHREGEKNSVSGESKALSMLRKMPKASSLVEDPFFMSGPTSEPSHWIEEDKVLRMQSSHWESKGDYYSSRGWGRPARGGHSEWRQEDDQWLRGDDAQREEWDRGRGRGHRGRGGGRGTFDRGHRGGRGTSDRGYRGGRGISDRGHRGGRGTSDRGHRGGRGTSDRGHRGGRGTSDRGYRGGRGTSDRDHRGGRGTSDRGHRGRGGSQGQGQKEQSFPQQGLKRKQERADPGSQKEDPTSHPSWDAHHKRKMMEKTATFSGKRITFDD